MIQSRVTSRDSRAIALALMLFSAGAMAQVGNDPTRPPPGLDVGADQGAEAGEAGGGTTLQSVMISPTRKAAIISGQMVRLGEKYGDAVLVKVTENEVVLKSGSTSQVLKLYPGVEKREVKSAAAKSAPRQGKARHSTGPAAAGGAPGQ